MLYEFIPRVAFYTLLLLITSFCCSKENSRCSKYDQEVYLYDTINSVLEKDLLDYRDYLSEKFEETPIIKGLPYTAYHLLFYSSHDYGESIKFEKNDSGYFIK